MRCRAGGSLAELLLVAWLFALVLLGLARFAAAQGRLSAALTDAVRAEELFRSAPLVLGRETRYLAAVDLLAASADSIRLRAIRGTGAICRGAGSRIVIRYRGVRLPDPTKDSVLVVHAGAAAGRALALAGSAGDTACGGGIRLDLDGDPGGAGGFAMVFETGSYHVADGAVRYRRGAAGRQPLTESLLGGGELVRIGSPGTADIRIGLRLHRDSLPRSVRRDRVAVLRSAPVPREAPAGEGGRP